MLLTLHRCTVFKFIRALHATEAGHREHSFRATRLAFDIDTALRNTPCDR